MMSKTVCAGTVIVIVLALLWLAGTVMAVAGAGGNSLPTLEGGCVWILLPLGEQEGKEYFAPVIECPIHKRAMQ